MTTESSGLCSLTCKPCSGSVGRLAETELERYAAEVPRWALIDGHRIERTLEFPGFKSALEFVNRVDELAERGRHHPDIHLAYGKVKVELWTHKVQGISVNDFILAAKIDRI